MWHDLTAVAATQGGVLTRRQALGAGCSAADVRAATRPGGPWVVVRRGAYAPRAQWETADDDGRYALLVRAALLQADPAAVASHQSAAVLHGLPMRPRWRETVHATRPGVQGSRRQNGVHVHPARLGPGDGDAIAGVRATGLARSAVDIARDRGYEDGVVACDAALRMGVDRPDLTAVTASMWAWPGVRAARAAVRDADGGAANVGESLTRVLVLELGIGRPETQFRVSEGGVTAYADLRVGPHLFEFDGRVKYVDRERGGVADLPGHEVLWREKQREDWLRSLGFGISRVVWADLIGSARRRTSQRLLDDFRATLARGSLPRGA